MIRVVIDPGVFISAPIGGRGGAPDLVVRAFVDDRSDRHVSALSVTHWVPGQNGVRAWARASGGHRGLLVVRATAAHAGKPPCP